MTCTLCGNTGRLTDDIPCPHHVSAPELVARFHRLLRAHGGTIIATTMRERSAWVLTVSATGKPTVAELTSRPVDGCIEVVTTCEPYAHPIGCPVALAAAAWLLERDPASVSPEVRKWRRAVAAQDTRPLSMVWGGK